VFVLCLLILHVATPHLPRLLAAGLAVFLLRRALCWLAGAAPKTAAPSCVLQPHAELLRPLASLYGFNRRRRPVTVLECEGCARWQCGRGREPTVAWGAVLLRPGLAPVRAGVLRDRREERRPCIYAVGRPMRTPCIHHPAGRQYVPLRYGANLGVLSAQSRADLLVNSHNKSAQKTELANSNCMVQCSSSCRLHMQCSPTARYVIKGWRALGSSGQPVW